MRIHVFGAGLSGLTAARLLTDKGFEVFVHEKSSRIGGALRTDRVGDTEVHKFGAHIFHTDNEDVYNFINRFSEWVEYKHQVKALIQRHGFNKLVQLPLSTQTLKDFYGTDDMKSIKYTIGSTSGMKYPDAKVQEMINRIGWDLFTYVIKNYSEVQWGCNIEDVPGGSIERIGYKDYDVKYYFTDKYQLLPKDGYDKFIEKLSDGISIKCNDRTTPFDYDENCIYTGSIDELMSYSYGALRYRTLSWEILDESFLSKELKDVKLPVINTPTDQDSTRIILHHNFRGTESKFITKEYPHEWELVRDELNPRFYPINDEKNLSKHKLYSDALKSIFGDRLILAGRLGTYKYLDMDDTILQVINIINELPWKNN